MHGDGAKVTKNIHIWVRPYDFIPMRKSVHNGISFQGRDLIPLTHGSNKRPIPGREFFKGTR